jgi:hypothetical protein
MTGTAKPTHCWCGYPLTTVTHAGCEQVICRLHGSAYKEDAEKKIRELYGNQSR